MPDLTHTPRHLIEGGIVSSSISRQRRIVMQALSAQVARRWLCRVTLLAVAGAVAATIVGGASPAAASCVNRPEYGSWVNVDPRTRGIASIKLFGGDRCASFMRAWGKCSPSNCDWGQVRASFTNGRLHGYYDQGFAKAYVYATMSGKRPGQLWVQWRTDFVDPGRADFTKHEWFERR